MAGAGKFGKHWARCITVLTLVALAPALRAGAEDDDHRACVAIGVRAADKSAEALLAAGSARSATFRAIVEELTRSDVIIYVEVRPLDLAGQLQLLSASGSCRHIRVSVRTPGLPTEQIAWLAHELMHAVEIARAPEVRDARSLRRLYERIGDGGRYGWRVESSAAQATWTRVLAELRGVK